MKSIKMLVILSIATIGLTAFATTSEPERKLDQVEVVKQDLNVGEYQTLVSYEVTQFVANDYSNIFVTENYKKGDTFKGTQGEIITLIKTRKLPNGLIAWKSNWRLNDKNKTIFVPEEYLKKCEKIPNQ